MWRVLAFAWLAISLPGLARAEGVPPCLSSGDAADVVASRKVIAPAQAIVAARHAVPNGDIMRASLCRDADALVYRLTAIRADGRVVRVTVDAPSGKVQTVH